MGALQLNDSVTKPLNHLKARNALPELLLVDPVLHEYVLEKILETPGDQYSYSLTWGTTSPLPDRILISSRLTVDNEGRTLSHMSDHWVLIHDDHSLALVDEPPTAGRCVNGITCRTIEVYNTPGELMPATVVKAIKITIGQFLNEEGVHYGVTWNRYSRK